MAVFSNKVITNNSILVVIVHVVVGTIVIFIIVIIVVVVVVVVVIIVVSCCCYCNIEETCVRSHNATLASCLARAQRTTRLCLHSPKSRNK